jgi:hypothetical protein
MPARTGYGQAGYGNTACAIYSDKPDMGNAINVVSDTFMLTKVNNSTLIARGDK